MGGAGGHMSHPYDLDEVTDGVGLINMLMSIPAHLAMDEINATIKLDGSNNSVKVIDRRGKLEFALDRGAMGLGKGEMDYQGLTPDDYEARKLNPGLQSSTNILLGILNDALNTANIEPELKAIGLIDEAGNADYSKFLNTEFYDKGNPNSIDYKIGNFIAFHGIYQFYEKFHRRGTPDQQDPNAKQVRGGLPRPTYVDRKDNKEKYKKVTSKRIQYDARALESLVKKVRPFAKKAGFEILGPAATKQKNKDMVKEAIADMKASLSKPITIQISKDRAETKTLEKWLKESINPLTTKYKLEDGSEIYLGCAKCIRMADGSTTNPYNKKKVYEPIIIDKVPIVDFYANSDGQVNAMAALNSAILFHATRLLGQDIKNHLTTDMFGDVTDHEGIVIRNLSSEDFKITGEFMVDDSGGFAVARAPEKDERLQEEDEEPYADIEILDDEDMDPVIDNSIPTTYAIVPGAFKPPHRGHADMVRRYATGDGVEKADEVHVIISAPLERTRSLRDGRVIDHNNAISLWHELYPEVASLPGVKFKTAPSDMKSPVTVAFKYISDDSPLPLKDGDKVILGASDKRDKKGAPDWRRWDSIDKEKHVKPGIELLSGEEYAVPALERASGEGFSASTARDLISDLIKNPLDAEAYAELAEFVPVDKFPALFDELGYPELSKKYRGDTAAVEMEESSGAGAVSGGGIASGSPPLRRRPYGSDKPDKKNESTDLDLSLIEEVMRLIIEKGIMR